MPAGKRSRARATVSRSASVPLCITSRTKHCVRLCGLGGKAGRTPERQRSCSQYQGWESTGTKGVGNRHLFSSPGNGNRVSRIFSPRNKNVYVLNPT